jgi:xanthine dehydrogenase accessory factor
MRDLSVWKFIQSYLKKNEPVILTAVLDSKGSSPGRAGFKMAAAKRQKSIGTIGGGEMEFKLLKNCEQYLTAKKKIRIYEKLYHSKKTSKKQSGLICAGNQTNFICSLNASDLEVVNNIIKTFKSNKKGVLVITPKGISFDSDGAVNSQINFKYESEKQWRYEEIIGAKDIFYICGGGHVGLALSRQMSILGFYVIVFDNRKDVRTIRENTFADKKIIMDYNQIGNYIEEGSGSYVAVVTTSYPTDKLALKQILPKKLGYLGLMGSPAKLQKIFSELKAEGMSLELLKKIHAPIGVGINSQTVEEIAVSIAAEVISVKNSG